MLCVKILSVGSFSIYRYTLFPSCFKLSARIFSCEMWNAPFCALSFKGVWAALKLKSNSLQLFKTVVWSNCHMPLVENSQPVWFLILLSWWYYIFLMRLEWTHFLLHRQRGGDRGLCRELGLHVGHCTRVWGPPHLCWTQVSFMWDTAPEFGALLIFAEHRLASCGTLHQSLEPSSSLLNTG